MQLAKSHLDIGLYTNDKDALLHFWQSEIGLTFDHLGKLGGGVHQLRHFLGDGPSGPILKINHARDKLENPGPSGYHELLIARDDISKPKSLTDPDGNRVRLVPRSYLGISTTAIKMKVRDWSKFDDFYGRILQLPKSTPSGEHSYICGETVLIAEEDKEFIAQDLQQAKGYRYITVQIAKADAEHSHIIDSGGIEGMPPRTLGTTVRYSFVRDFDGNWIELSQRATLTGSLD